MEDLVLYCLESRFENNRNLYARFLLGPFLNNHALTIATALRRALLSEVEGIAITALNIQGITHEFSTIVGVRESVVELSINFQQIVLRSRGDYKKVQVGYLHVKGPAIIYANDLKLPLGIECVDPTQYIATLSTDGLLVVKFLIEKGIQNSYLKRKNKRLTANNIQEAKNILKGKPFKSAICLPNIIPLASFLTPVNRVNFVVEPDDLSNKVRERVLLEVWTNGSLHPRQAINEAALSLITMFSAFRKLTHLDSHSVGIRRSLPPESQITFNKRLASLYKSNLDKMSLLSSDLSNMSLALKTYTYLKQKGIHKLDTLLEYSPKGLLQLVNGNKKMFYDIKRCILTLGLNFKE
uniref:RNA polymerase alpha subunit n=1 Tax=Massjukichlorella minus TaxID=2650457 RepID=UPI002410F073|nr:RNA polymerase alpha subunit [Massjukichlorella minus]WDY13028.1 RNA polymerase alpha subunit [Massjukichlorella minus]